MILRAHEFLSEIPKSANAWCQCRAFSQAVTVELRVAKVAFLGQVAAGDFSPKNHGTHLVGGWTNPSEKYYSSQISSPGSGWK